MELLGENNIILSVLRNSIEGHQISGIIKSQQHQAMRYVGGKCRIRKQVSEYINKNRKEGQAYYEPFVGSAWILMEIKGGPNYASDVNKYLIAMWKALQKGWIPPSKMTQKQYDQAKEQVMEKDGKGRMSDELLAFIGFGCSFYGMWFSQFAHKDKNYAKVAKDSLLRKIKSIPKDTKFKCMSYEDLKPEKNSIIYCDPPYADTVQEYSKSNFDSEKFWEWCRKMSKAGHTVLISEYKAPKDFKCVLRIKTTLGIHSENRTRYEKLFQYK
jgi:DNA adenine methylase